MSIADHFEKAREDDALRRTDAAAARRQFHLSLALIAIAAAAMAATQAARAPRRNAPAAAALRAFAADDDRAVYGRLIRFDPDAPQATPDTTDQPSKRLPDDYNVLSAMR